MPFKKGYIPWNKGKKGYTNSGSYKKGSLAKNWSGFKKGHKSWNTGVKGLQPWMDMSGFINFEKQEKHPDWTGDNASYSAIHQWVSKQLGKPNKCKHCNKKDHKILHWANISGEYKRDLKDWIRLSPKCHGSFDINRENKKYKLINGKYENTNIIMP